MNHKRYREETPLSFTFTQTTQSADDIIPVYLMIEVVSKPLIYLGLKSLPISGRCQILY